MSPSEDLSERFKSLQCEDGANRSISKYLAAIDFGTKFSAAAFAPIRLAPESHETNSTSTPGIRLADIKVVDRYPSLNSARQRVVEAPSVLIYDEGELRAWGCQIEKYRHVFELNDNDEETNNSNIVRIDLAKLLLDETERSRDIRARLNTQLAALGLTAVDVIADYLRGLYRAIRSCIDRYDGAENRPIVEVAICAPALWSPLARRHMRLAAKQAGMSLKKEHGIISEPDAVAAFLLEKHPSLVVDSNKLIVVCDSGGGTADVTTLNVVSRKPTIFTQAAAPDGDLCGSVFLDRAFEVRLRERLEQAGYMEPWRDWKGRAIRDAVNEFFDTLKRLCELDDGQEQTVRVSGVRPSSEHRCNHNFVRFSEQEFRNIFDPIVRSNIDLVIRQITSYRANMAREGKPEKPVQYIFFVGGMAGSPYVVRAFEKAFSEDKCMGYSIEIKTPSEDGATANAHGTLLLASEMATVKEARICQSYGITRTERYDENVHHDGNPVEDPFETFEVVHDRMKWIVQKEDIVASGSDIPYNRSSGMMYLDVNLDDSFDFEQILYRSDKRIPDAVHLGSYKDDITKAYRLTFNLADAVEAREICEKPDTKGPSRSAKKNKSSAKKRTNAKLDTEPSRLAIGKGQELKKFYRIKYEVVIQIVGTEMTFNIVAPPGGPVRKSATFSVASDFRNIEEEP